MSDDIHDYGPVHASWDEAHAWDDDGGIGDAGKLEEVAGGWQWRVSVPQDPAEVVAMMVRYHGALNVLWRCRNPMKMLQEVYGTDRRRGLPGMPWIRAQLDECLEHHPLRDYITSPPLQSRKSDTT